MQRSSSAIAKRLCFDVLRRQTPIRTPQTPSFDVFINHRRIDTRRTVAGLLHHYLTNLNLRPFIDSKNMFPGDNLFHKIDSAIHNSKIGVAVFSPHYCESYFCMYELALIMETKKKVIPIFCDVKPSQLRAVSNGCCTKNEIERFSRALEEAKNTVGITFDSSVGDWSELLRDASDAVMKSLLEVNEEWHNKINH